MILQTNVQTRIELQAARSELDQAWHNFNQAEPSFVDAAIYRLQAAERKYGVLIRQAKEVQHVS